MLNRALGQKLAITARQLGLLKSLLYHHVGHVSALRRPADGSWSGWSAVNTAQVREYACGLVRLRFIPKLVNYYLGILYLLLISNGAELGN